MKRKIKRYKARAKTVSGLTKEFERLARTANDRLRALEKLAETDDNFSHVLEWAYHNAIKDIQHWRGEGATRFAKPGKMKQTLKAQIYDINTFLNSTSSTKTGLVEMYKNNADKINKRYGTKFTWEDMGQFFESSQWKNLAKDYGSRTAIKSVGEISHNMDEIKNALENDEPINLHIKNRKVNKAVNKILNSYGVDELEFFA